MDKAGNFIGWLHMDGANLSVLLVEQALSKVHFTAERSAYYKPLLSAEEAAKQRKEKVPSIACAFSYLFLPICQRAKDKVPAEAPLVISLLQVCSGPELPA